MRIQSSFNALRATHLLQEIIAKLPEVLAGECHKIERLNYLANQQYEHLDSYDHSRKVIEKELAKAYGAHDAKNGNKEPIDRRRSKNSDGSFTSTLLACGDSFTSVFCPGEVVLTSSGSRRHEHKGEYKSSFPEGGDYRGPDRKHFPDETRKEEDHRYPPRPPQHPQTTYPELQSRPSLIDQAEEEKSPPSYDSIFDQASVDVTVSNQISVGIPVADAVVGAPIKQDSMNKGRSKHSRTRSETDLQRALFVSGLQVEMPTKINGMARVDESAPTPFAPPGAKKRESGSGIAIDTLSQCYHEDFDALRTANRVRITHVSTYQGRVPNSTNGCTVIAPLLCIHHFHNTDQIPDPGLPDEVIVQVMDEETPNILPLVRETLGLVPDAFLIPADAHESLMKQSYMCQEQFLSVSGGNILEEEHLNYLCEELAKVRNKKLGATFFFHEHVITILQLQRGKITEGKKIVDEVWFDVIDSLPHEGTLLGAGESSSTVAGTFGDELLSSGRAISSERIGSERDSSRSSSGDIPNVSEGSTSSNTDFDLSVLDHVPPCNAARIRCMDVEALKVTLKWYACSVFTAENRAYIDAYHWDENLIDFDPRVFQAFLWTSV